MISEKTGIISKITSMSVMHWALAFSLLMVPRIALAICTCGYLMTDGQPENNSILFTDKLETDFGSMKDLSQASEWTKQQFNVSAVAGRGTYGKTFLPENVFLLPEPQDVQGDVNEPRGIALRVGSQITSLNAISAAEVDTSRRDMFWGSYRATMKLSRVSGTCAAFFWVPMRSKSPKSKDRG